MLDVHRIKQFKGNMYQVDRYGCRTVSVYIRLVILDSSYVDVKIINYQASNKFKYHVGSYSYPVIPFNGTTFNEVVHEATKFMCQIGSCMVSPRFIKILAVNMERAMEGTNMRIVTVTMTVEGIEVPDPDRHDNIFIHLGLRHRSWIAKENASIHTQLRT